MIKQARFQNVRVLRDATLPLAPFTLIVGPNGSGKSTALRALCGDHGVLEPPAGEPAGAQSILRLELSSPPSTGELIFRRWENKTAVDFEGASGSKAGGDYWTWLQQHSRLFSFNADAIIRPVVLQPKMQLGSDGAGLAGVLDRLRDEHPERFEALNAEIGRWLPEFDRILFQTPEQGKRSFLLRMRDGHHSLPATHLSQGTVLALALLTLAHLPEPPALICVEEPDRGLHPRLFRHLQDALYRLAYPKDHQEPRDPVQVVVTTHSPYLLDLFRDHPEEVVIAHKDDQGAHFVSLSDQPDLAELLEDDHLGDIWYSGILGGVPDQP